MAADTVGKQRIRSQDNTDVVVRLADTAGTNLAAVDASGRVAVDLSAQTLAAVKISRDGATPAASNGSYVEVTTANAVLAANNPLAIRPSNGTAYNSATAPLFSQLTNGTTVNAAAAPIFAQLSNGTAVNSATVPIFVQPTNGTAVNSVTVPVFARLTDGAAALGVSGNPLYVTSGGGGGTTVLKFNNGSVASAATTNSDYTVTSGKTLTITSIIVTSPEAGNFLMTIDPGGTPVSVIKLQTSPGSTTSTYTFTRPVTAAAGLVVRVAKTNDSHQAAEMAYTWEGYEV